MAEPVRRPVVRIHVPAGTPGPAADRHAALLEGEGYATTVVEGGSRDAPADAFAVLAFGDATRAALDEAARPDCAAFVCFDAPDDLTGALEALARRLPERVAVHRAGGGVRRPAAADAPKRFFYPAAAPGFALSPRSDDDRFAAGVAYSRTLDVLKRALGPRPDLAALFAEHLRLEFEVRDADATMLTMVDEPYVNHVPTMTGGTGHDVLKRFYAYHFIPGTPRNRRTIVLNEIVGADAVVIEGINCFTHDAPYDHLLPGVPPTGRDVEIPFVAIAKFRGDKLFFEHIYWDQASVLVQLGLLDPTGLPVCGVEQTRKVLDPSLPSNTLMSRWADSEGRPVPRLRPVGTRDD